jgi:hypothetical protein
MKFFRLIINLLVIKTAVSINQLHFCESQKFTNETTVKNVTIQSSEAKFGDCEFGGSQFDADEWNLLEVSKFVHC